MERKLKPCPFCGKFIPEVFPALYQNPEDGDWYLSHFCDHDPDSLSVTIHVYGKTKEEVIERWNHRAEVETSESL